MIEISLTAASLAQCRFSVSPSMQAAAVLHPHHPGTAGDRLTARQAVDCALKDKHLPVLSAIRAGIRTYAPDFLTPALGGAVAPTLDDELHRVACTPTETVSRQMNRLIADQRGHAGNTPGQPLPSLRQLLDGGERAFAQRAAGEMEVLWRSLIAPQWPSLSSRAEDDLDHRARTLARCGLTTVLNALHPAISCGTTTLNISSLRQIDVVADGRITLFPSPLATKWLLSIDPWGQRGPYLIYPVPAEGAAPRTSTGPAHPLAEVIGASRFVLLTALEAPRTTTELAERHHFSASTVSYHLAHLHRTGLVTRERAGKRVYYRRTAKAATLLDQVFRPGALRESGRRTVAASAAEREGIVST
ncbi:ArsR/SmtB family transcription factor [Streptomyces sp. NPDC060232]|uniref:ArsR/SmtB family transcription factor n=1 Tax=Streptomyces sp. NPDC060232 TaxID=3347079 RepID=UPI0036688F5B